MSISQTISGLPAAPSRQDPSTFSDRADAFMAAMEDMPAEQNTWAGQTNALAAKCNTDANIAADAAAATISAAVSAGASIYSSSTTYAAGALVLDPDADYELFVSQAGSNIGHTPGTDSGTWWKPVNNYKTTINSDDGWFD